MSSRFLARTFPPPSDTLWRSRQNRPEVQDFEHKKIIRFFSELLYGQQFRNAPDMVANLLHRSVTRQLECARQSCTREMNSKRLRHYLLTAGPPNYWAGLCCGRPSDRGRTAFKLAERVLPTWLRNRQFFPRCRQLRRSSHYRIWISSCKYRLASCEFPLSPLP